MSDPLRIVTFNNLPPAFDMVRNWAEQSGHTLVLAVTTPGPRSRRSEGYKRIAATAGEKNIEVLVTTRLKTVATPVLRELKPDLIVSMTFPWLLPPELLQTARIGAVNLHPAALPAYRGPNVMRQIYEESPVLGCTLHWTAGEFDTGNILTQHIVPLPRPCTPEAIGAAWFPLMAQTLFEGTARAIAGDPGTPQPSEGVSYAAPWTEAEEWLDFTEAAERLQCKVTGLNLMSAPLAKAKIGGQDWLIERLDLVEGAPAGAAGAVIEVTADGLIAQTGSGAVRLKATRLPA